MLDKSNLPKFDPELYKKLALNDLVVYSIHHFQRNGREITSEDIISACFLLFPKRFAMRSYPHWPDSAVVSRRWTECRSNGYLIGNALEGFRITAKGARFAEQVAKRLGVAKPKSVRVPKKRTEKKIVIKPVLRTEKVSLLRPKKRRLSLQNKKKAPAKTISIKNIHRSDTEIKSLPQKAGKGLSMPVGVTREAKVRAGKFVHAMERSDAFIHYRKSGKNSRVGEFDFRSLLLCTMESSRETLAKNLDLFKGYASILDRQDLLTFLADCESRFSYLLAPPHKPLKKSIRKPTKP